MMMFFFSLIPATVLVVVGYFILYASHRSEGKTATFGKFLSIWVFILAALVILGGIFGPIFGMRHRDGGMRHLDGMSRYWQYREQRRQMNPTPDAAPQSRMDSTPSMAQEPPAHVTMMAGHTHTKAQFDALREKIDLYKDFSDEEISFSMVRMGPNYESYVSDKLMRGSVGVLLLAHGFREPGDSAFRDKFTVISKTFPTAIGFGMSMMTSEHIQAAVDDLTAAGAKKIIVIPTLSSPYNTQMRQWEYMFSVHDNAGYLETPRIKSSAKIILTPSLADDPLVAEILLDQARELSTDPANEIVAVVSHGPSPKADNDATLAMLERLATIVRDEGGFVDAKGFSLQNDSPPSIRQANVDRLRNWIAGANAEGKSAIIVTNLISVRSIQSQIKKDLAGLDFRFKATGMTEHPNFIKWVEEKVDAEL